ncbi:MAG: pssY [Caulobacteraceae bacterium]|nr:pssY [Caulobacteraceae bacterium]
MAGFQMADFPSLPKGEMAEIGGAGRRIAPAQAIHAAPARSAAKRLLDIVVALAMLLLFLPLLVVIAAAVRAESSGPALYRQRRTGLGGAPFTILKFRTMTVADEADQVSHCTRDDTRLTALGAVLRRLSLDELPQLINVLAGDMSLVGPRPHALLHDDRYAALIPAYAERFRARPGLTGFAQINGLRGEIRDLRCMMDRVSADNLYIDEWSLWMDVVILFETLPLMFSDPKAY